jgi:hypothetical protein
MQPDIIPHAAINAAKQTPTRTLCIAIMKTLPSHAGAIIAATILRQVAQKSGHFQAAFTG